MPFSRDSLNVIWKRSGGTNAKCFTCKQACADGWSLDASHLDHTRDESYDDPSRGELECLSCHLTRHIRLYYEYLYKGQKKRSRESKYACLAIINRILAGEDRHDRGAKPRKHKEIKEARHAIADLIKEILKQEAKDYKKLPKSKQPREFAKEKLEELIDLVR